MRNHLSVLANFPAPWRVLTSFTGSSRRKRSSALARDDAIADKSATSERNSKFTCDVIARRQAYYSVFLLFVLVVLADFSPRSVYASSDELYFLHTDHLGSTRAVTDRNGNVVARFDYYPYGSINNQQSAVSDQPVERLYTSQIKDSSTDLYFYNARYYNPVLGTFISPDTLGGGYSYANKNPIMFTDPTGHRAEGGGGGVYLPLIMKQYSEQRLMGKTWKDKYQETIVDPSSDPELNFFLGRAVDEISTPEIKELYATGQNDKAQLMLLKRTTKYVRQLPGSGLYQLGLPSDHNYPKDRPSYLGSAITEGEMTAWEKAILIEVTLTTIDPSIESYVVRGRVGTRFFSQEGNPYTWVRAKIGDEYYSINPIYGEGLFGLFTQRGFVPESQEDTYYEGVRISWSADYISTGRGLVEEIPNLQPRIPFSTLTYMYRLQFLLGWGRTAD